jgi:hypothetical protein
MRLLDDGRWGRVGKTLGHSRHLAGIARGGYGNIAEQRSRPTTLVRLPQLIIITAALAVAPVAAQDAPPVVPVLMHCAGNVPPPSDAAIDCGVRI